jgi:hypothetical protein
MFMYGLRTLQRLIVNNPRSAVRIVIVGALCLIPSYLTVPSVLANPRDASFREANLEDANLLPTGEAA